MYSDSISDDITLLKDCFPTSINRGTNNPWFGGVNVNAGETIADTFVYYPDSYINLMIDVEDSSKEGLLFSKFAKLNTTYSFKADNIISKDLLSIYHGNIFYTDGLINDLQVEVSTNYIMNLNMGYYTGNWYIGGPSIYIKYPKVSASKNYIITKGSSGQNAPIHLLKEQFEDETSLSIWKSMLAATDVLDLTAP